MSYATVPEPGLLTIEEYLEREASADIKHEYVAGHLYAFTGASRAHNIVVTRLMRLMLDAAGDGPCQVFGSDMLLRAAADLFYYPDVTVTCDPRDQHDRFNQFPCLIVEVLSPSTIRTDLREKLVVYRNLDSLRGYLIAAQDTARVDWHWRDDFGQWQHAQFDGDGEVLLPCVDIALTVSKLYEDLLP